MAVSGKLGIGVALVAIGVGGLAFTMPIIASAIALDRSDPSIFDKTAKPTLPGEDIPYIGVEIASAASLAIGIALSSVGLSDTLKPQSVSTETPTDQESQSVGNTEAA